MVTFVFFNLVWGCAAIAYATVAQESEISDAQGRTRKRIEVAPPL